MSFGVLLLVTTQALSAAPVRVLPVVPANAEIQAQLMRSLEGRLDPDGRSMTPEAAAAPSCPRDDVECLQQVAGAVTGLGGSTWALAAATFRVGDAAYLEITAVNDQGDAGTRVVEMTSVPDGVERGLDAMFPRLSAGPYAILVDGVEGQEAKALLRALGDSLADQPRIDPEQVRAAARAVKEDGCRGDCLAEIGRACGARHVVRAIARADGDAYAVGVEIVRVADDAEVARTLRTWSGGAFGAIVDPGSQTRITVASGPGSGLVRVDGAIVARLPLVAPIAGVATGDHEVEVLQGEASWRATVPIAAGRLVEVAAPAAGAPARRAPRSPVALSAPAPVGELQSDRPRILVAALGDGLGVLENRVAAAASRASRGIDVQSAGELRGSAAKPCLDLACAQRLAAQLGADQVLAVEVAQRKGGRRAVLSRYDSALQRVTTVEVAENNLDDGVRVALGIPSSWATVGGLAILTGVAIGVVSAGVFAVSASESSQAQRAVNEEERTLHEEQAGSALLGAAITGGVALVALAGGAFLVWGVE